ncbi:cation:proton antiporter [Microbacterium sp. No. 7]|uniref:cation:proton antiporter n=1 Tax=Microbacterium sp. No. 7 TaxID=1714373 RepID=UPI0006D15F10|nr:sodium:proton antiporter [Microbacterium sp. No. 7]ALJ22276.1 sodium:proton antiporter [Microbacterium sp. No. 7]
MEELAPIVIGVVVIATTTMLSRWLGIAGPLLLVAFGLVASLFLPPFEIDPELILVGVLPPLLYAAAVRLPAIEFRRDFVPISGLAVVLVVGTALLLGWFFTLVIPGLGFAMAVALGAILSPTDAVATSIIKRLGIAPRVVTMLEGESLLNDATSLVLLRSAVAAAAAGFSFWGTVGSFAWGVVAAVIVGAIVGYLALRLRALIRAAAGSTALGFVVPFAAYLPTEHLGGSGLVAAVVAGIVMGQGAPRRLTPEQRVSDELNWRTIETVLEGAVFLIMGLELRALVSDNLEAHGGVGTALGLAAVALAIVLLVRAVYVSFIVAMQSRNQHPDKRERLSAFEERLGSFEPERAHDPERAERVRERMSTRLARAFNDLDYYQSSPLGWKHGTIIVWAGMRGVVTLAAAQTLPRDTPARELLILVAFFVAVGSLLIQGLTVPWVIRMLRIPASVDDVARAGEAQRLDAELRAAAVSVLHTPGLVGPEGAPFAPETLHKAGLRLADPPDDDDATTAARELVDLRFVVLDAMRARLIEVSHGGAYSSEALRHALASLDAEQLSLQLRRDGA